MTEDQWLWWGLAAVVVYMVFNHHPGGRAQLYRGLRAPSAAGGGCGCSGPAPILADASESQPQTVGGF